MTTNYLNKFIEKILSNLFGSTVKRDSERNSCSVRLRLNVIENNRTFAEDRKQDRYPQNRTKDPYPCVHQMGR